MDTRRLGRTGHMSSIIVLGVAALWNIGQDEADAAIEKAVNYGVNHFDFSPSYGDAEVRIGSWLMKSKKKVFLGCKTRERGKNQAWESINRSLETLQVDSFELFQLHGVDDTETLNVVLGPGGALEALLKAKEQKMVRFIGITGHRPFVHIDALNRFDFDTVMFPLNRVHAAHRDDWNNYLPLLEIARQRDVGVMAIKSIAKRPWEENRSYRTWYEPFEDQTDIDRAVHWVLKKDGIFLNTSSDIHLLPKILDAASRFKEGPPDEEMKALISQLDMKPIFDGRNLLME